MKKLKQITVLSLIIMSCLLISWQKGEKIKNFACPETRSVTNGMATSINNVLQNNQISVNISVSDLGDKPLQIQFTPVSGGSYTSVICFSSTSFTVPTGIYDIKFSIPASGVQLHQIDIPGYSPIWIQPFPDNPAVRGAILPSYSISSNITINIS
ncbi:hypothetical protein [Niabella aquatica]